MATLILRPDGNGNAAQHTRNTGSSNWSCCDETSSDGDTTYVSHASVGDGLVGFKTDWYNHQNYPAAYAGLITRVRLHVVAKYQVLDAGGVASFLPQIRYNGVTYQPGAYIPLTGSYVEYTHDMSVNPVWGSALNSIQAGFNSQVQDAGAGGTTEVRFTQCWLEITYNEAFVPLGAPTIATSAPQPVFVIGNIFVALGAPELATGAPQPTFVIGNIFILLGAPTLATSAPQPAFIMGPNPTPWAETIIAGRVAGATILNGSQPDIVLTSQLLTETEVEVI